MYKAYNLETRSNAAVFDRAPDPPRCNRIPQWCEPPTQQEKHEEQLSCQVPSCNIGNLAMNQPLRRNSKANSQLFFRHRSAVGEMMLAAPRMGITTQSLHKSSESQSLQLLVTRKDFDYKATPQTTKAASSNLLLPHGTNTPPPVGQAPSV